MTCFRRVSEGPVDGAWGKTRRAAGGLSLADETARLTGCIRALPASIIRSPPGWDKTYSLRHIEPEGFEQIHFFGDKVRELAML